LSKPYPKPVEILELDRKLAAQGVPVTERANKALLEWIRTPPLSDQPTPLIPIARWFEKTWRELHPSVVQLDRPFMYLAVSALGVSYRCDPPIVFGTASIDIMKLVHITPAESQRIFRESPRAGWEMYYQALDAVDLWLNRMDLPPKQYAGLSVAFSQLEASARQLVACSPDSSLPQSVALIAELSIKGALFAAGFKTRELEKLGHNVILAATKLCEISKLGSNSDLLQAAASVPPYVASRYSPPPWEMSVAQNHYRTVLYIASEALRRSGEHRMGHAARHRRDIPARPWT
jgi:hypothetical protein